MTLYTSSDLESHRARIVLAEKGIITDVVEIDRCEESKLEDLRDLNPYQTVPTLVDRDLVLHQARIIMEYLDERFPHPPLLSVYPIVKAKTRLMMHRIESDWYPLVQNILKGEEKVAKQARKDLQASLIKVSPAFKDYPYCLSEEFSLVDCSLAPILWRLPILEVELPPKQTKPLLDYADRLFKRNAFKKSLTEEEIELRG